MEVLKDKIVVTGYGVKALRTNNTAEFVSNFKNGVCCLQSVSTLLPNSENTIVSRIKEGLEEYEHDKRYKRLQRVTLLGMSAGMEAINMLNYLIYPIKKSDFFCVF